MRRFLRAALGDQEYNLIEASTAREGLAQAAGRNPELILLDLGLPDSDGLDVTRQIREWSSAPIIVISARGQESDKVAALDAGADDYLTKPSSHAFARRIPCEWPCDTRGRPTVWRSRCSNPVG